SGTIAINPAPAHHLTILTQPSLTATAGVAFAQQPVIRVEDQFNNLRSADNSTVVTATRNAGSGTLQGTTSITAAGGLAAFTNLSHNVATTLTIDFNAAGLLAATSSNVVVSAAAATSLAFVQPPGDAQAGAALSPAVSVQAQDAFGNGVPGVAVAMTMSTGTGTLSGTTTRNTDTNGLATFDDLSINLV